MFLPVPACWNPPPIPTKFVELQQIWQHCKLKTVKTSWSANILFQFHRKTNELKVKTFFELKNIFFFFKQPSFLELSKKTCFLKKLKFFMFNTSFFLRSEITSGKTSSIFYFLRLLILFKRVLWISLRTFFTSLFHVSKTS